MYVFSCSFVIALLRKNLFLVFGNVIVRYSKALKKVTLLSIPLLLNYTLP